MQLLAVIVPPPEVVQDALEAAQALCSTAAPTTTGEPRRGLLARMIGRRAAAPQAQPDLALRPLAPDDVFVRVAKFGNVTGDDAEGLTRALAAAAGTWPAPVLHATGVSVAEAEPHTVTVQLGGEVGALRDIFGNVNEVARQQRFFLDRRSFRSELVLGSVEGEDGAAVPATVAGAEVPHVGPSWTPTHVTLVRTSLSGSRTTYSPVAQVELAGAGSGD